jgi:hypothetical protein
MPAVRFLLEVRLDGRAKNVSKSPFFAPQAACEGSGVPRNWA